MVPWLYGIATAFAEPHEGTALLASMKCCSRTATSSIVMNYGRSCSSLLHRARCGSRLLPLHLLPSSRRLYSSFLIPEVGLILRSSSSQLGPPPEYGEGTSIEEGSPSGIMPDIWVDDPMSRKSSNEAWRYVHGRRGWGTRVFFYVFAPLESGITLPILC